MHFVCEIEGKIFIFFFCPHLGLIVQTYRYIFTKSWKKNCIVFLITKNFSSAVYNGITEQCHLDKPRGAGICFYGLKEGHSLLFEAKTGLWSLFCVKIKFMVLLWSNFAIKMCFLIEPLIFCCILKHLKLLENSLFLTNPAQQYKI
jgi:hypothetical protein